MYINIVNDYLIMLQGPVKLQDSIRIGHPIRKGLADSKIFESNRPYLPLARRKLSQTIQTINGA